MRKLMTVAAFAGSLLTGAIVSTAASAQAGCNPYVGGLCGPDRYIGLGAALVNSLNGGLRGGYGPGYGAGYGRGIRRGGYGGPRTCLFVMKVNNVPYGTRIGPCRY